MADLTDAERDQLKADIAGMADGWGKGHMGWLTIPDAFNSLAPRIIAALDAAPRWQPIETAPKDESCIILGNAENETAFPGFWHGGEINYWKRAGWYEESDRSSLLTAKPYEVTHWQPLPIPPDPQQENDRG